MIKVLEYMNAIWFIMRFVLWNEYVFFVAGSKSHAVDYCIHNAYGFLVCAH